MSPIVAGKELEKIEQQLSLEMEEERKKKAEEDSKKTVPSVPEECVCPVSSRLILTIVGYASLVLVPCLLRRS